MPSMRAVLVRDGKSESAEGLYIGEAERPTLKEGDGRVIVKVRSLEARSPWLRIASSRVLGHR